MRLLRYNSRMVRLKTPEEIEMMRRAGRVVAEALAAMRDAIVPDETTTLDLDEIAAGDIEEARREAGLAGLQALVQRRALSAQHLHFGQRCRRAWCPEQKARAQEGDIVSLDMDASIDGWCADATITVPVGAVSSAAKNLLTVTREAFSKGSPRRVSAIPSAISAMPFRGMLSAAAMGLSENSSATGSARRPTKRAWTYRTMAGALRIRLRPG